MAILPYRAVLRESTQNSLQAVPIAHPALSEATIDVITLRKHHPARIVTNFIDQLRQTFEITAAMHAVHRATPSGNGVARAAP